MANQGSFLYILGHSGAQLESFQRVSFDGNLLEWICWFPLSALFASNFDGVLLVLVFFDDPISIDVFENHIVSVLT